MHTKYFVGATVFSAAIALTGCGVGNAINKDYVLPKNKPEGLVALSVTCLSHKNNKLEKILSFGENVSSGALEYTEAKRGFFSTTGTMVMLCNNQPYYFMRSLKPGRYQFDSFNIASASTEGFSAPFVIRPGQVSYLGHLFINAKPVTVMFGGSLKIGFSLYNWSKKDVPYFMKQYPHIPRSAYKVRLLKLDANQ